MKYKITILAMIISFSLTSCFVEDEIIDLPPLPSTAGELEYGQAALTETYKYQVFYDLVTNTTVKTNLFSDWDFAFSTSDTSWDIRLNNAKRMYAGNSFNTNFEEVISEEGIDMWFDRSDGNPDSLAIGAWADLSGETPISYNYVYVINRGFDENFGDAGYRKIVFETPEDNKYKIRFAQLNGDNEISFTIEKDTSYNYVYFSLDFGLADIEPPKNDWTLLFTLYQTLYEDLTGNFQPYMVNGALLNPNNVNANIDTLLEFYDITINDTQNFDFKTDLDIIGFDWKYYNFEEGFYSIVDGQNYFIQNNDGYFYKLRFIDFYNDSNEKGYPTFEFARL